MCWPVRETIWPHGLDKARQAYASLANTIVDFEPVTMVVPEAQLKQAQRILDGRVQLLPLPLNDSWARDICPIFVVEGDQLVGTDWIFNSWGEKFRPWNDDARLAERLLDAWRPGDMRLKREACDMVLEGGAIHGNGQGLLLTTEECLLNPNRNPELTRSTIEQTLCNAFSAQDLIWLPCGIAGDLDTDGHVDNVACFMAANTIAMQRPAPGDVDEARFEANMEALNQWMDRTGKAIDVATLPMPETRWKDGNKVPQSYINFVWANGAVIVPQFAVEQDQAALEFFQRQCPGREIIPLPATPIVEGGGGFHCITMQVPSPGGTQTHWGERT
jgi:agmatine deiminase